MGITIFYRGTLRDLHQIPQLVAQIETACDRLQWPYEVIDERILGTAERYRTIDIETDDGIPTSTFEIDPVPVDDLLRGILIGPSQCDTLSLTFGRTGRLIDYGPLPPEEDQPGRYGLILETLWTKTQFSSPEVHIQVCELLRIAEAYMAEWEVIDEGDYWGQWDVQVLETTWAKYAGIIAALSDPATLQEFLDDAGMDMQVTRPPEVGKQITITRPAWRQEWGVSAGDN